jgi:hypothetical protein
MSETLSARGQEDSYFADNAQLLKEIMGSAGRVLDASGTHLDFDMNLLTPTLVDGLPGTEDFLEAEPTITQEEAARAADMRRQAVTYVARTALLVLGSRARMYEIADEDRRLHSAVAPHSGRGPAAKRQLAVYHPTRAAIGSWRHTMDESGSGDTVMITEAKLWDRAGVDYASEIELIIEDSLVKKTCSVMTLKGEVRDVRSSVVPTVDPLVESASETLDVDDLAKVNFLMTGVDPTNIIDINTELNNIWLNYLGTGREQEVGQLLDEIRMRHLAAKEALALFAALGEDGKPSFQELVDLNSYLADF